MDIHESHPLDSLRPSLDRFAREHLQPALSGWLQDRIRMQTDLLDALIRARPDPMAPGTTGIEQFQAARTAWQGRLQSLIDGPSLSVMPQRIRDGFDQLPAQLRVDAPPEREQRTSRDGSLIAGVKWVRRVRRRFIGRSNGLQPADGGSSIGGIGSPGGSHPESIQVPLRGLAHRSFLERHAEIEAWMSSIEGWLASWLEDVITQGGISVCQESALQGISDALRERADLAMHDLDSLLAGWLDDAMEELRSGLVEAVYPWSRPERFRLSLERQFQSRCNDLEIRWRRVLHAQRTDLMAIGELDQMRMTLRSLESQIAGASSRFFEQSLCHRLLEVLDEYRGIESAIGQTRDEGRMDADGDSDRLLKGQLEAVAGADSIIQRVLDWAGSSPFIGLEQEIRTMLDSAPGQWGFLSPEIELSIQRSLLFTKPDADSRSIRWAESVSQMVRTKAIDPAGTQPLQLPILFSELIARLGDSRRVVETHLEAAIAEASGDRRTGGEATEGAERDGAPHDGADKDGAPHDGAETEGVVRVGEQSDLEPGLRIASDGVRRAVKQIEDLIQSARTVERDYRALIAESMDGALADARLLLRNRDIGAFESQHASVRMKRKALGWRSRLSRYLAMGGTRLEVLHRWFLSILHRRWNQVLTTLGFQTAKVSSATMRMDVTRYLIETDERLTSLPFIYRRLFRHDFVIDRKFFITPGSTFGGLQKAIQAWMDGVENSIAIIGEKGSGKSTAMHVIRDSIPTGDDIAVASMDWAATIHSPVAFTKAVALSLGLPPIDSVEELITAIQAMPHRRILLLDGLHNLFIRTIHGFDGVEAFVRLLSETRAQVLWVVTCNRYAWEFLSKMMKLDHMVSHVAPTDRLSGDQIRQAILLRHRATGFSISYESDPQIERSRAYRRYLGQPEALQKVLADRYFEMLSDVSEGNLSVAMVFWVRSIRLSEKDRISIMPLSLPDLELIDLSGPEISFVLSALAVHDSLRDSDLAAILSYTVPFAGAVASQLHSKGILHHDGSEYRINPLIYRQMIRMLKTRNILH